MRLSARVLVVSLLLSAALMLSGCIDIIYQVQVAEDGSGGVRVIAAYDARQLQELQKASKVPTSTPLITEELRREASRSGLQIEEISSGQQGGLRVTGTFASPEEFPQTLDRIERLLLSVDQAQLLANLGVVPSLDGTLTATKGFFTSEYALALASGETSGSGDAAPDLMAQFGLPTKIDRAAVARLPGEVVSTNGRYQPDDASLVWPDDPEDPKPGDYVAVSRVVNRSAIALVGFIVLLVLVAAAVYLVRLRRRSRPGRAEGARPTAARFGSGGPRR